MKTVVPEDLRAESLLLATGLVKVPDRHDRAASMGLLRELHDDVLAVLEQELPAKFRVIDLPLSYLDKLVAEPDYAALHDACLQLGDEVAVEYVQIHRRARDELLMRKPTFSVTTVLGTRTYPPDETTMTPWLHQADLLEQPGRLAQDFAACALVSTTCTMFSAAVPKTYKWLVQAIDDRRLDLAKTEPPYWLDHALQTFFQGPPPPRPASSDAKPVADKAKGKFDAAQLRTDAQEAFVPQKR